MADETAAPEATPETTPAERIAAAVAAVEAEYKAAADGFEREYEALCRRWGLQKAGVLLAAPDGQSVRAGVATARLG